MNPLLDSAAFLWLCGGSEQLSPAASRALADTRNVVAVSAVTAWEIALKQSKGKLKLPVAAGTWFPAMVEHHRLKVLPIEAATAIASTKLPSINGDPFDRLLIATACELRLHLVTPDSKIHRYPNVQTLW